MHPAMCYYAKTNPLLLGRLVLQNVLTSENKQHQFPGKLIKPAGWQVSEGGEDVCFTFNKIQVENYPQNKI